MDHRPPRLPARPVSDAAVLTPPSPEEPSAEQTTQGAPQLSLVTDVPPEAAETSPADPDPSDGSAGRAWRAERARRRRERVKSFWGFFEGGNPYTNYWLVLGPTIALAGIGLTMVLSSTSVDPDGQPFTTATRQAAWAGLGVVGMFLMTLVPTRWLGGIGWLAMISSASMLMLVAFTGLGSDGGGSTNWLQIGSVRGQPSELAKLALVLWGAAVLAKKGSLVSRFTHWMMPFVAPGALAVLALVLAGGDLGTSIIIILIVGTLLFAAGVKLRYFAIAAAIAAVAVAALMWMTPYRMARVNAWLGINCDHPTDPCMQSTQGFYALASGGFWGVGLGQSRQKWDYIPEVHNDFIFTIIGEELGLLGTFTVLGLFMLLVVGVFRVASNTEDRFAQLVCIGIAAWLVGQAFINIAMVTGLLPVVGVPLPFISYGGSALTCALLAVGVVLNFARRQRREARRPTRRRRRAQGAKGSTLAPLNQA
ncbi:putative lipid II flippase FtsW [Nesterenkonia alba]|uniref:putative lipid II flippase FtsW n=1 Tax=Nesterenkonia alba TaxID=515814 RepID=UPI0003B630F0|nr:putative lipid II flippase FtsW [Nesterenkonia alba]